MLQLIGAVVLLAAPVLTATTKADEAARSFMIAIDSRYEELRTVPRRMEMRVAITQRTMGEPDAHLRGTATITQLDRRARFEMDTVSVGSPTAQDCSMTPAGHLVWVIERARLSMRFEPAAVAGNLAAVRAEPTGSTVAASPAAARPAAQEMRADFEQLPRELGLRFRDPMGEPELGHEFLNHPFTLRDGILDGRSVKVLRSVSEVVFSRSSTANVTFWVDPQSLLILRAVYDGAYAQSDEGKAHEIATEMDLSYQFGVPLPDGIFTLDVSPQARDITDIIAREGRAALGLLP